jgi:transposase
MPLPTNFDHLEADALRQLLIEQERELVWRQSKIERLTHELALYKRQRYGVRAERLSAEQARLFEETTDADLAAMSEELEQLQPDHQASAPKGQARRKALPPELPRTEICHEPESTTCACGCQMKRIGEDVAEKLDYTPGHFTVERHIRGKWACAQCQTLVQAPVAAHIIDKGIPTAGLLAQVMVAKYQDHLPLYRQEGIFGRAGLAIPRSTLAQWVGQTGVHLQALVDALKAELLAHPVLHADETPVAMLDPGSGKTHRAYLWSYSVGAFDPIKAVIYDFTDSRAGRHAQAFLQQWRGTLVCDDYAGYKTLIAQGVKEAGCMAHARRKFFDLTVQGSSQIAGEALEAIGQLYGIEREVGELEPDERLRLRQERSGPILDRLHAWLLKQRTEVPNGSSIARAIDYSLKRWAALTHYLNDARVPIDNNWIENQIRPIALGRKNWLFAGSLRAGQRAAAIMSLIQSARLNGHEPFAYLKDVLERLPTQPYSRIGELLPHRWQASA